MPVPLLNGSPHCKLMRNQYFTEQLAITVTFLMCCWVPRVARIPILRTAPWQTRSVMVADNPSVSSAACLWTYRTQRQGKAVVWPLVCQLAKATADLAGGILVEQNTLRLLRMALTSGCFCPACSVKHRIKQEHSSHPDLRDWLWVLSWQMNAT